MGSGTAQLQLRRAAEPRVMRQ